MLTISFETASTARLPKNGGSPPQAEGRLRKWFRGGRSGPKATNNCPIAMKEEEEEEWDTTEEDTGSITTTASTTATPTTAVVAENNKCVRFCEVTDDCIHTYPAPTSRRERDMVYLNGEEMVDIRDQYRYWVKVQRDNGAYVRHLKRLYFFTRDDHHDGEEPLPSDDSSSSDSTILKQSPSPLFSCPLSPEEEGDDGDDDANTDRLLQVLQDADAEVKSVLADMRGLETLVCKEIRQQRKNKLRAVLAIQCELEKRMHRHRCSDDEDLRSKAEQVLCRVSSRLSRTARAFALAMAQWDAEEARRINQNTSE